VSRRGRVHLDLNSSEFQEQLFRLDREDLHRVLLTLRKLFQMTWNQVYRDRGLKWEAIGSRASSAGARLYSLRVSRKFRAAVIREADWLRFVSLHPDHDSTYDG
jgi:hypothetical protein